MQVAHINHMKKIGLILLFVLNILFMQAASLTEQEAYKIAQKYNKELSKIPWKGSTQLHKSTNATNPEYYIFNVGSNKGFIIITGETDLTEVVGYSDCGNMDVENIPENLSAWLNNYAKYVNNVRQYKALPEKKYNHIYEPVVSPLLRNIAWEQNEPFNAKCPYDETAKQRCVTGCVATAMAQIMKYWEWPMKGTGSFSYTSNYGVLSSDFSKAYHWNLMKDSYNMYWDSNFNLHYDWTPEEEEAVSQLLYDLGVGSEMNYTPYSSGGNYIKLMEILNKNFYYNISSISRSSWSTERWTDLLKAELNAQHPLFTVGTNINNSEMTSLHAFVIDGYDTAGYFHVNWGWGPTSVNGYFNINYLNAGEYIYGGANGDDSAYSWNTKVWIPVPCKNGTPQAIQKSLRFSFPSTAFSIDQNTFHKSDPFQLKINQLWSDNSNIYNGELRICIEDSTKKIIATSPSPYHITNLTRDKHLSIDLTEYVPNLSNLNDGSYTLYLQSKETNTDNSFNWIPIEYTRLIYFDITNDIITIHLQDDYSKTLTASINCNETAEYNHEFKVACTIRNYGNYEANGFIQLDVFNAANNSLIETLQNRVVIYDHSEALYNFNLDISKKYTVGETFYTKLSFRNEDSESTCIFNTNNATSTFLVKNETRKQTSLTFHSFTEYAGILLTQSKFFTTEPLYIDCQNMYNMNPHEGNFKIVIGLFDLTSEILDIGEAKQIHFNNYEYQNESLQSPNLSSLNNGNYYFEPLSKEIYQDINYEWIPFDDIQSRCFFKKVDNSGYYYNPQNVIDVYDISSTSANEVESDFNVQFSLKNISYNDANGTLFYQVYNENTPNEILATGEIEIFLPRDGSHNYQTMIPLSASQFGPGEDYIFELYAYTDNEDSEKTLSGNNIKFRTAGNSGIQGITNSTTIYPSPVVNTLIINSQYPIHTIKTYNLNGQLVMTKRGNNMKYQEIDVQDLMSGIYFLHIETETGIQIKKFIIARPN